MPAPLSASLSIIFSQLINTSSVPSHVGVNAVLRVLCTASVSGVVICAHIRKPLRRQLALALMSTSVDCIVVDLTPEQLAAMLPTPKPKSAVALAFDEAAWKKLAALQRDSD